MGRKSREHRARRDEKARQLEAEIFTLMNGDANFWTSEDCPANLREEYLQDILAFESVGTGTSLFNGLQEHGTELPHPDTLDEGQSAQKNEELMLALWNLQIVLVGHERMSARQLYSTLWNKTLWEGCYVKKRHPTAVTVIDVSRSPSPEDRQRAVEMLTRTLRIQ